MVAVSRYAVGSSLLMLSLLIGCDHNVVEPSSPQFRVAEPPSSASAVAVSESRIDVTWPDNSSSETGFEVHRSTTGAGGAFTLLATTGANVTGYSDKELNAATQYCYEVRSFRTTGKQTSYSAFTFGAACATTRPLTAPSAATAVAVSDTRVDVAWQDNSATETGFEVHRYIAGFSDAYALLVTRAAGIASYSDVGLASSRQYCYKIRAFQTTGGGTRYSEFSAPACASTGPPPAPTIYVWPYGSTVVEVGWDANPANTDGFHVERSLDGGASWTAFSTTTTGWYQWSYDVSDGGRTPEEQVCYRVFAFNGSGDSGPSNTGCTAPPARPTGLAATIVDSLTIDFAWSDNSAVEDGYAVGYFAYQEGWIVFYEIQRTAPNATSLRVSDFEIGLSEDYNVVAVKDGGYSDFSNGAIPGPAPAGVHGVTGARTRLPSPQPHPLVRSAKPTRSPR